MEENNNISTNEEVKEVIQEMKQEETVKTEEVNNTYAENTEKKLSIPGLISFILALIGIWQFGLPLGIAAVILGIVGIATFKKDTQKGRGFAIAGLCLGAADVVIVIMYLIAAVALLNV